MQHLRLDVLQASPLPSTLPAHTELGVWKRSTGFEVFIPFHRHIMYWVALMAIQIALVTISVTAYQIFPLPAATERMVFYVLSSGLIISYTGYLLYKLYETRHTRIRLDLSSDTISITRVLPSGASISVGDIPVAKIDEVYIDEDNGMRVSGKIPDPMFEEWFGTGLRDGDLYYLALLIGQVAAHPEPGESYLLSQL